ncbi:MAG: hypothetical protein ACRD6N_16245, partial [Pyrinomonadaceae bacterium]
VYVADTGNNRIRKITPQGVVSTVAGDGTAGHLDGPASQARFDAPIGVAVDAHGNIFVADTYNDRIRMITPGGEVTTIAGVGRPGFADGAASSALFDTPCSVVVTSDGALIVADTGNHRLRKISTDSQVTTLPVVFPDDVNPADLRKPMGLAMTHDGFLYVTELDRARVIQIAPDGAARVVAGGSPGYADGSDNARFNQPAGIAINPHGDLYVADSANYVMRKLAQSSATHGDPVGAPLRGRPSVAPADPPRNDAETAGELLPRLSPETLGVHSLLWPLDPQQRPHEVVATIGEVRGSFDSTDSRDHFHSGLDVFGAYGNIVRAVRSEKVTSPLANWGFGDLNEGLRVGIISYIHIHVGRSPHVSSEKSASNVGSAGVSPADRGQPPARSRGDSRAKRRQVPGSAITTLRNKDAIVFNDPRFVPVQGEDGKIARMRIRRGTRFRPGDALGSLNRMYHVHLNVGPPDAEINPLSLSPVGFTDDVAPVIEKDGIQLLDEAGAQLTEKRDGRLVVHGRVRIVVDAFDRTNMNRESRRLGLYRLGYQVLKSAGPSGFEQPAPGFKQPRINIEFNRLPADREATKVAYAVQSGITVYGSATSRFLYEVTNTVRDGRTAHGVWDTSELPSGDYILRIIAADYSGNEAKEGRDVLVTVN